MDDAVFRYPLPSAPYSVEDCQISGIGLADQQITFFFKDGVLDAVSQDTECRTSAAGLIVTCDPDDVLCSVYAPHGWRRKRWYTAKCPGFQAFMKAVNQQHMAATVEACWLSYRRILLRAVIRDQLWEITVGSVREAVIVLD